MDMKGLAAGLCGLGKELEGKKDSREVFQDIINIISKSVNYKDSEDSFVLVMTGAMDAICEKQSEDEGETGKFHVFDDNDENAVYNAFYDVAHSLYYGDTSKETLKSIISHYTYDEHVGGSAQSALDNTDWGDDDEQTEETPESENEGGGTVHVSAHTRGDVEVKAYDRDPPSKTGGDARTNIARCEKCSKDATHRITRKDKTSYHVCGDCHEKGKKEADYATSEEIRQHEHEIPPHMRAGKVVNPYTRKPTYIKTGGDSLVLDNQPIAKEGVLPYPDGRKLKRWEDLEKNIGREVPIVDEHPPFNNGNRGLLTGAEKTYGKATIKRCGDKKMLCAMVALDDGAPAKEAYSIGFPYLQDKTPGVFGSAEYDEVQKVGLINHLALTNYPRDKDMQRRVAADSDCPFDYCVPSSYSGELVSGDSLNHNTSWAVETLRFSPPVRYRMDAALATRAERLHRESPELNEAAVLAAADHDDAEPDADSLIEAHNMAANISLEDLLKLQAENAELKAQAKAAGDSTKAAADAETKIKALEAERDAIKTDRDSIKTELATVKAAAFKADLDSLKAEMKSHGWDDKRIADVTAGADSKSITIVRAVLADTSKGMPGTPAVAADSTGLPDSPYLKKFNGGK